MHNRRLHHLGRLHEAARPPARQAAVPERNLAASSLLLHTLHHVTHHKVQILRRAQVLQQVGCEHAVPALPVRRRRARSAGERNHRAGGGGNLSQPAAQVALCAAHRQRLAAARVQDDEVQVAPGLLNALQHRGDAKRLVVQVGCVLLFVRHRDEVVLALQLQAVTCQGDGRSLRVLHAGP